MTGRLTRLWDSLSYRLYRAARGGGKPVPVQVLDDEYRSGRWDSFGGEAEAPRYRQVLEYALTRGTTASVLDLGCGSGQLARLLDEKGVRRYQGVDLSSEGLARARALGLPQAQFLQADVEAWRPSQRHDVIIFNECVGYLRAPGRTVQDFSRHLLAGGIVVVSLYRWGNYRQIWQAIERGLEVRSSRCLDNQRGQVWDIKLLQPRERPVRDA